MTSRGRSSVPREQYGTKHEICGMVETEEPGRVLGQLKLLARSLLALQVKREVAERIVRHAAISSMPGPRAKVLLTLHGAEGGLSTSAISNSTELNWKVANRAAEDLEAVGFVTRQGKPDEGKKHNSWEINPERAGTLRAVLG